MKVLFIGDPHIKLDNLDLIDKFIVFLKGLITDKSIDIVIVGGDLMHYHERLHTLALNKSIEFCVALSSITKTYVLVGNHDMINNQQFLNENHWMNCMKGLNDNLIVVDKPTLIEQHNNTFILVPYTYTGRFKEALNTLEFNYMAADIIFAHQEFKGCKMGAIVSEHGDVWELNEPMVISGHIHDYQKPQPNIFYTGAPLQHSFGDRDENIVLIIDINDGKYTFEEVDTGLSTKKILYTSLDKIKSIKIDKDVDTKITIECTNEEFKTFKKTQKYKELTSEGVKIVCKSKVTIDVNEKLEISKDLSSFEEILKRLVLETENKLAYKDFVQIFCN
jgi:DNA repair exonuclease SbcCD nuclease subunit